MRVVQFAVLLLGFVFGPLLVPASAADKYPTRPIKFVVGFLAGGPNDIVARIFCDFLQPHLGQPCVVENKAGQGGMIAAKSVIDSPADGYTIMPTPMTPAQFGKLVADETEKWGKVVKAANISVD